ncbi:hypothetical protein [Brevibacterium spongiae]|uniref:Glycosyltransferase RgtA/B/C/D-like domain-containing protein n=1 Tax=Brevibacterium spongiae TaxID=2909672 RepID=A0ABY5SQ28_9MICO|nr:hypothetical protein [Brevibacterium spongiae]UVI35221.1 hypothetical protein L1F31_14005 [Brevibacterium spongiae]
MTEPRLKAARPLLSAEPENAGPSARLRTILSSALAWDILLAAITLAWSVLFVRLFFPGRVNVDIAEQYLQATGKHPFTDWHPPVMSAVWHGLIELTGEAGSLLVLQVGLLAASAWLIGVLLHRTGTPRWMSLLGPAMMATPWVVSQMTTLWKDTQLAVALLLGTLLIVITRFVPRAWILWLPALVLLVYAVGVRKNAVFAVVPIAVYGGWCILSWWRNRREPSRSATRKHGRSILLTAVLSLIVLVLIGGGVKATDAAIDAQVGVEKTGQISQIFLDDVMFSVPESRLQASDAPQELKDHISSARDICLEKGETWDAYWNCYGRGTTGRAFSPIAYQDELKKLWLSEVITHPVSYIEYRTAVFSSYFFSSKLEYWEATWDGDAEKVGFDPGSVKADYIFRPYVEDFALATFPMLFKPWFWTLVAVVLLGLAYRARRRTGGDLRGRAAGDHTSTCESTLSDDRASARGITPTGEIASDTRRVANRARTFWPEITTLAASALCYVFGYFPIVPANHFRYTFWPALALTAAGVLAVAMWRHPWKRGPGGTAHSEVGSNRVAATPRRAASSNSET